MAPRSSGLLLHLSSLPGPYGIGDLGPQAYYFANFLRDTRQSLWQVLPFVPVGDGYSPYASPSTFAGNPLFISPERLVDDRLLDAQDLTDTPAFPAAAVDFARVIPFRHGLLRKAFERFEAGTSAVDPAAVDAFCRAHAYWLDDYALFQALKHAHGEVSWVDWPAPLAKRDPDALAEARQTHAREIRRHKFWQFLFFTQWQALKAYCNERSIQLFGDLPIYVAHDSADVWAHPDLFHLDAEGRPTVVAGVPPDYFSETGQRWGNPIYRWDVMQQNGYRWWTRRLAHTLRLVDRVRLDHFRGFAGYWEIPADEETAIHGRWVDGPGAALFTAVKDELGKLPLIAEDLGLITPDVTALMDQFDLPGMAVIQFAFGGDPDHSYLPHNYRRNLVAYTGTHDNDTIVGWWEAQQREGDATAEGAYARRYLGRNGHPEPVHWAFVRLLSASVADLVVFPVQDLLGLGRDARMNTPGLGSGNWTWRFTWDQVGEAVARRLRTLTETYGRAPAARPGA